MRITPRNVHGLSEDDHSHLAHAVMKRQAALSLRVAAVFVVLVFGLPLVNFFLPKIANTPVLGFSATWLFLGIVFFPITWMLSAYFIRESDKIESTCSDWPAMLGAEAGEPLEPEGVGDIKPAFIDEDVKEDDQ